MSLQTRYDCYFLVAEYQVSDHAGEMARVREAVWLPIDFTESGGELTPSGVVEQVSHHGKPARGGLRIARSGAQGATHPLEPAGVPGGWNRRGPAALDRYRRVL